MFFQKQTSLTPALMGLAVAVGFLCISGQSLWIDEANSAIRAIQPTWNDFWEKNIHYAGSDLQMPGYMLSLWAWEKIFGHSEYALRAMNIPFFLLSVGAAIFALKANHKIRTTFSILIIFSPMVWIYMDEARPYTLQFTGATLTLVGLVNQGRQSPSPRRNFILVCSGILVLCAASLTGVVFALFFGLSFAVIFVQSKALQPLLHSRSCIATAATGFTILTLLGAYYFWTLQIGARASSVANTSWGSVAFAFYELLGFTGLGPDRLKLRSEGLQALTPFLPALGAYAAVTACVFVIPIKALIGRRHPAWLWTIAIAVISGTATIILLGIIKDFRIVGRHLMPLLPFLLLFLAGCLVKLWDSVEKWKKALSLVYLCLLTTSSLSARIDDRFQKDYYRSAAKLAQSYLEQGKIVWWAADEPSLLYYIPDAETHITSQTLFLAFGTRTTPIHLRKTPDLILLSKPDIYDPDKLIYNFIKKNSFKNSVSFKAFSGHVTE
jgi:hypothetical protein